MLFMVKLENLRKRIDEKLVSNEKTLKWTSKPNVVAIRKNKFTLTLNKPAYVGMWIFDLSKVLCIIS